MPDNLNKPGSPISEEDAKLAASEAPTVADHGDRPAVSFSAEKPASFIGRYKLLKELGKGGFGIVWHAEQTEPIRREVALKIIKPGMDSREIIARFEAERQALALMDHPNIAAVLDAGTTDRGLPYFVMELVKGMPITEYCDTHKLGIRERLELFIPVCQAVQHAHQKAILHRDLKPSNILVTEVDGKPAPKVIDFGIAKALGTSPEEMLRASMALTQAGMIVGTPQYMSPEQAGSMPDVDTRSDIYTLGVILYELLVGETPLSRGQLQKAALDEVLRLVREGEPQRPSSRFIPATDLAKTTASLRLTEPRKLGHALRGDLDWILLKALEKDRARRYDTANAFAQDLQRHLSDEPVSAGPPSAGYRLRKLVRRNRLAFAAGSAVVLALFAGITVSSWQAVRAMRAEEFAKQRVIEVAAERDAKDKARQDAEAVSTFFTEVFQSPDPERDGRTITVAETLDRAAKKLESDLASDPARRVGLQATLARTYAALGLRSEAIALFEKIRDYTLTALGPRHPDTLRAMGDLANSYTAANRLDEALKMRTEVLALCRTALGPEHPQTLTAMTALAYSYRRAFRVVDAVKMQQQVLSIRRKMLGPEHPDTVLAMNTLGSYYALSARNDVLGVGEIDARRNEALKTREEVVALCRKVFGPEHPDTLTAMSGLADSYRQVGRSDEALKIWEEVLVLRRKVGGPTHPDTLTAMWSLARFYRQVGRYDQALKMQEEVLALDRKMLGPEHSSTLVAMNDLADVYADWSRIGEALPLWEESFARFPKQTHLWVILSALQLWFGKDEDYAATSRQALELAVGTDDVPTADRAAKAYFLRPSSDPKLLEAAVALARQAVELAKDHPYSPWSRMGLGMAEYRRGSFPAADRALSDAEEAGKNNHWVRDTSRFFHSMSLFRQGKEAEARQLFAEAEAQMKPLPADEHQPLANGANCNDVILWLAFKESRVLLKLNTPVVPTKPKGGTGFESVVASALPTVESTRRIETDKKAEKGLSPVKGLPRLIGVDALALVDPARHAQLKAVWTRTENGIKWESSGAPLPYAGTFQLPLEVVPSYAVEIEFTCAGPRESIGIAIPVGDDRVTTCWFHANGYAGIGKIDGEDPRPSSIPGTASRISLQPQQTYTTRAEVRQAPEGVQIQFLVDGVSVATYRGPTSRLTHSTMWLIGAERRHIMLGADKNVIFQRATIKALDDSKTVDMTTTLTPLPATTPATSKPAKQ